MLKRKGAVSPAVIFLGGVALIAIIVAAWPYLISGGGGEKPSIADSTKFGDAIGVPRFNFVSYILGEIPQFLIDWTNEISATIVMIALFLILVFMFSDILTLFGTFSNEYISWTIGTALAIIAANLKVLMWIAVFGFSIASGLGVLSVIVGIATPFIVYLAVHFLFLKQVGEWVRGRKNAAQFKEGVDEMTAGVKAAKSFGKAVRDKS